MSDRGFAFSQDPGQAPQITERLTMRIPRGAQALDQLARSKQRKQTLNHSPSLALNEEAARRKTGEFGSFGDHNGNNNGKGQQEVLAKT